MSLKQKTNLFIFFLILKRGEIKTLDQKIKLHHTRKAGVMMLV